jgi:transposase
MARPLVPDELWEVVQPLLPHHRARPGKRGRPPVDDRACLTGIIFVLQSGIPWGALGRPPGHRPDLRGSSDGLKYTICQGPMPWS